MKPTSGQLKTVRTQWLLHSLLTGMTLGNINTKGSYAEPQRLSADAEELFRAEQGRMAKNREVSRSDLFHVARQPSVQVENHPNQETLDLGFKD